MSSYQTQNLIKLKLATKNETRTTLRLSSHIISNSNDKTDFPHELLLTNGQVPSLPKAFANNLSTKIKLSKTQLSKVIEWGGCLGSLLKIALLLMENVLTPFAKSVLIPLESTEVAPATEAATLKKRNNSRWAALTISNEEVKDILKIVKSLKSLGY